MQNIVSVIVFGFFWVATAHGTDRIAIHEIPTRVGVSVPVMVITPEKPSAAILLFPGGNGRVTYHSDGSTGYRGFPVRKPGLFAQQGFLIAVMNTSSDTPPRHFFRDSSSHTEDIHHVIAFLRKETDKPLWLVGHSAGSTSVANAAIQLRNAGITGIVLISSENGKPDLRSGYLDKLNVGEITVPTLVVHHEQDECEFTLFENAQKLMRRLNKSVKAELVAFNGGGPVSGDRCGSLHYHGFPGIEQEVAARIAGWIKATINQ